LISTASQITAVGSTALGDLTTGNNNVGLGYNSGRGVTTGINNTIIGANITGLTANLSDTLIIATGAGGTASYRIFSPSSGNILIGTTTDAGFRLDVNGSTRIGGGSGVNGNLQIVSGTGQFYPTLSWVNNGSSMQGQIAGFGGGLYTQATGFFQFTNINNVTVGGAYGGRDNSAILQVNATNRGFLPPRMTTAERDAIVSPATGLVLFNTTTDTLQVRASTGWINL
jgi:hypothetical protein